MENCPHVDPTTSEATLVATPRSDLPQSSPLLAVPAGETYLHIPRGAEGVMPQASLPVLSANAPNDPRPQPTPNIWGVDGDVRPIS